MVDSFDWTVGNDFKPEVQRGLQIAVAAFGALAVLRTAVIQIQIDDRDVRFGPHWFLNVLLNFTAKRMSQRRASHVQRVTTTIMSRVDFDKAKQQLPSYCFSLLKTPENVQKAVSREITSFDVEKMANKTKSLQLGLVLLELVGEEVLSNAVKTLSKEICLVNQNGST